jgi:hypothetical protein
MLYRDGKTIKSYLGELYERYGYFQVSPTLPTRFRLEMGKLTTWYRRATATSSAPTHQPSTRSSPGSGTGMARLVSLVYFEFLTSHTSHRPRPISQATRPLSPAYRSRVYVTSPSDTTAQTLRVTSPPSRSRQGIWCSSELRIRRMGHESRSLHGRVGLSQRSSTTSRAAALIVRRLRSCSRKWCMSSDTTGWRQRRTGLECRED